VTSQEKFEGTKRDNEKQKRKKTKNNGREKHCRKLTSEQHETPIQSMDEVMCSDIK
jgi:hypothetical protein